MQALSMFQRILQNAGCGASDVAYGDVPFTVLNNEPLFNGQHYQNMPPQQYLDGIDTALSSNCSSSPWKLAPAFPYPFGAAQLIISSVKASRVPIDILLLGPFTNFARALSLDPSILTNIGTVYVSGGAFYAGRLKLPETSVSGFYPSEHPKKYGGQNYFLDAIATSMVFGAIQRCQQGEEHGFSVSCPEVKIMSTEAQHMLQASTPEEVERLCAGKCTDKFNAKVEAYWEAYEVCADESLSDIYYWDESAAVMAAGWGDVFCTEWVEKTFLIDLDNGKFYSAAVERKDGVRAKVCMKADRSRFLEVYWEPFRKNSTNMCNNFGEFIPSRLYTLFSVGGYVHVSETSMFYIVPGLAIVLIVSSWIRFRRTSVAPVFSGVEVEDAQGLL